MAHSIPWNMLGLMVSGDVGAVTLYKNKNGKVVAFPKDEHQEPSPLRARQRERFRLAQQNWKALTDDQKASLEAMSRKLWLPMTGQNVFISVSLRNDAAAYQTLATQSGIELPPFTPIPQEV